MVITSKVLTIALSALGGGIITKTLDYFFIPKKDGRNFDIELMKMINQDRQQIYDRLNHLQQEYDSVRKALNTLSLEYELLQKKHTDLVSKYQALKKELEAHRSQDRQHRFNQ